MDFQKTERPLADSRVYILTEIEGGEERILACFATNVAAEMAARAYGGQSWGYRKSGHVWYEITEMEVLDQTPVSEGQGSASTEVGEGSYPEPVPDA
jgi:hypothetical protein